MAGNTVQNSFTIGTTAVQVMGPSDYRLTVVLSGVSGGRVTIGPLSTITDGSGIVIQSGDPPVILSRALFG